MRDGRLLDPEMFVLARQAVDLLCPSARVSLEALDTRQVVPKWGGETALGSGAAPQRAVVWISQDNQCAIAVNPLLPPAAALASIIRELSAACRGQFRGAWFPNCPDHEHPSTAVEVGKSVEFRCPSSGSTVASIAPDVSPT